MLDDALATVGREEGEKPRNVVTALGRRTRVRLYQRLAEAGLLRAEEGRILGVFPTRRWPAEHTDHEAVVRAGLVTAERIAEGDWVGKAVRSAIDTGTAIIAGSSSAAGGGGS
ncbi:GPP34 family phosphoprotein [Geodermatophilus sp. SYSU D00758]